MHASYPCVERVLAGNGILLQAGAPAMIRWIDRETFDEMILTNAEASLERMIDGAKPLLDTIRRFIPEADLFYRIYYDESERTNHVERVYPGFRRNGILFLVSVSNTLPRKPITTFIAIGRPFDMRTTTTVWFSTNNPHRPRVRGQQDNERAEKSKCHVYRQLILCSAYARNNGNSKIRQV